MDGFHCHTNRILAEIPEKCLDILSTIFFSCKSPAIMKTSKWEPLPELNDCGKSTMVALNHRTNSDSSTFLVCILFGNLSFITGFMCTLSRNYWAEYFHWSIWNGVIQCLFSLTLIGIGSYANKKLITVIKNICI